MHFNLMKTRAILVETSSLRKKCAGAEGEELVIAFFTFFNFIQFDVAMKAALSGSCEALFVHFFGHSMAIFFLKTAKFKGCVCCGFHFCFSSHDDLSMGLTAKTKKSNFHHLLLISSSSPSAAAGKNTWKQKKIDGCRTNFNYCSKAHTKPNKGEGTKKKNGWKIISFVSAIFEKERENSERKVSCWGQRSRGKLKFAFSTEDHFQGRVFPA